MAGEWRGHILRRTAGPFGGPIQGLRPETRSKNALDGGPGQPHFTVMPAVTPVPIVNPPPLWKPVLANCRALMREVGAPAILIEGSLRDTPFGPRIVATLGLPAVMGPVAITGYLSYRRAMRDAAGLVGFVRMAAHSASGIGPAAASREPEDVSWDVIVLPADVVLIARTESADYGPFLLAEAAPEARHLTSVARQLDFAGIAVGEAVPPSAESGHRA